MRFFFVSNLRLPSEKAASLQSMTMCAEFARLNQVVLVAPRRKNRGALAKADPFQFYQIEPSFDIKFLPCLDWDWLQSSSEKLWFWLLNFSFLISAALYLGWNVRRSDILYTRDEQLIPVLANARRQHNCKIYWECHAVPQPNRYARIRKHALNGIVTLTQAAKDRFVQNGFEASKILVAHDGVHLKDYDLSEEQKTLRHKMGLPTDKIILTYVGRFQTLGKEKGIVEILKAAAHFANRTDLLFVFVGGPMTAVPEYERIMKECGTPSQLCTFHDRIASQHVPAMLKASDVLLMPFPRGEHYEVNMSPLKMFEYMAALRPIITTNLPTIREVLRPDEAYFCEPGDPQSLAEQINSVLASGDLGAATAKRARERVTDFTWTKRADSILAFTRT